MKVRIVKSLPKIEVSSSVDKEMDSKEHDIDGFPEGFIFHSSMDGKLTLYLLEGSPAHKDFKNKML